VRRDINELQERYEEAGQDLDEARGSVSVRGFIYIHICVNEGLHRYSYISRYIYRY